MLLIADDDQTGVVDMPVERLAARAGLSVAETKDALALLSSPDPDSSSPEHDGRRILPIREGGRGWRLVNWEKYREIATTEHKRNLTRARVASFRQRQKGGAEGGEEDENEKRSETALESTNGPEEVSTHVQDPDFAMAGQICAKIEASGLRVPPPLQLVVAWMGKFGVELITETIEDCNGQLNGKHHNYLAEILLTRFEDESQRPSKRRKRAQATANKDGNGAVRGPDGLSIPEREGDYWGGN